MNDKASESIDFTSMSEKDIQTILNRHQIRLNIEEVLHIQSTILSRPPSLTECLLWSIQGSEHCSYKSTRPFLQQLPTKASHFILGPGEDAGIVAVATDNKGERYGIALSHESHNHPSQIVPFEGAATGVGGNVRDIACMGATVIAVADSLRFGDIRDHKTRWLCQGVVDGISSYGNALGLPNIAGDIFFHPAYKNNCLVTVVSLGIVKEKDVIHSYVPAHADGYTLILVGKATDNSGFGGASFASIELDEKNKKANRGAVQEPNAFLERHLLKATTALIEKLKQQKQLHRVAFKDLGAGGIACASVELADSAGFGCEIDLDKVHTSLQNLHPSVILCAETQERFMWAVPPELSKLVIDHYNDDFALPDVSYGAKATVVGHVTKSPQYKVHYQGKTIVDAKASDITSGLTIERPFTIATKKNKKACDITIENRQTALCELLAHPAIASKKTIYQHYDKQVQGRTVIERGLADAGVIEPFNDDSFPHEIKSTGIALSVAQNPYINVLCAYQGAKQAVASALEKVAAVGASPLTITDCLCFGNPENPKQMGEFVEATKAIADICNHYHLIEDKSSTLAVIAGNVSLYNESQQKAIPASPMISCLGKLPDVKKAINSQFKKESELIFQLAPNSDNYNGSILASLYAKTQSLPADIDLPTLEARIHYIVNAINKELITACKVIAEGGLAVALCVMATQSNIGCKVDLQTTDALSLFCETGGFVFTAEEKNAPVLQKLADEYALKIKHIGHTNDKQAITIDKDIHLSLNAVSDHWQNSLSKEFL